ncbi:MAG TPA: hypothetical protein VGJ13_16015 [Pseudonocardiaceae bacterium]
MNQAQARDVLSRTPNYEFRSAGKLCTACGVIVGNVSGDDRIHEQWHEALAAMFGGGG